MNYTVIVPFYNEEKNVSRFNNELIKNLEKSNSNNRVFEIIYVDDGSNDNTFQELKNLKSNSVNFSSARSKLSLSRFGTSIFWPWLVFEFNQKSTITTPVNKIIPAIKSCFINTLVNKNLINDIR